MNEKIEGFSKLTKLQKIQLLLSKLDLSDAQTKIKEDLLKSFWHVDPATQKVIDEFTENALSNFHLPFGIIPNALINQKNYFVPMVIEESSVVAASARSFNFWYERGGIKAKILGRTKLGQVHFKFFGDKFLLFEQFESLKPSWLEELKPIISNMEKRGGGLKSLSLLDKTELEADYFQLWAEFETCDAMGANFINTVLEFLGKKITAHFAQSKVIMCILSNYTPDSRVLTEVSCTLKELNDPSFQMSGKDFAVKILEAIKISKVDKYRATTHNKGIMNGIDAVVIATGNDFRAVEACVHTYASRDGVYRGLSDATIDWNHQSIDDSIFTFKLEIPMALGTVGGLTALHPLAKLSLDILGRPSSDELMMIVASVGLAQNFAALRSLVTSGIQKGHMKMHLMNILNHYEASEDEVRLCKEYFANEVISFNAVREFLTQLRNKHVEHQFISTESRS